MSQAKKKKTIVEKWKERVERYRNRKNSGQIELDWSKNQSVSKSEKLRAELYNSGVPNPTYKNQAHHIVASEAPDAAIGRQILKDYDIAGDSAANGVFLPANNKQTWAPNESIHGGGHTIEYYEYVNGQLEEVVKNGITSGLSHGAIRENILDKLTAIGEDMLNGKISINMK